MAKIDYLKLRKFLARKLKRSANPPETLRKFCIREYQVINFHPTVYGFVIPAENLQGFEKEGVFVVVIFNKIPDHSYLLVEEREFSDLEEACKVSQELAKAYPEYGLCSDYEI